MFRPRHRFPFRFAAGSGPTWSDRRAIAEEALAREPSDDRGVARLSRRA
jgi:hypothetical protein